MAKHIHIHVGKKTVDAGAFGARIIKEIVPIRNQVQNAIRSETDSMEVSETLKQIASLLGQVNSLALRLKI